MTLPAPQLALTWLRENTLDHGGIRVHSRHPAAYPEVTGYLIPTLLQYGERARARRCVDWLLSNQTANGAWRDPDGGVETVFDTGQVLRGLICYLDDAQARTSVASACRWMQAQIGTDGTFGERYQGTVPETVHLFAIEPMSRAASLLGLGTVARDAKRAAESYLKHRDLFRPESLTHFLGYEIDALLDLGLGEAAQTAISGVATRQRSDGSIPARAEATWTCLPGQAQLATCLMKAGLWECGFKALEWLETSQSPSGGFRGSQGPGADYFPDVEVSWGAKFYLDAHRLRMRIAMERLAGAFPDNLQVGDGRLTAIARELKPSDRVLEVGCGKARFARALSRQLPTCQVIGLDLAPRLLDFAPDLPRIVASVESLPIPDASMDAAFAVEVLEHSANLPAAVEELARVVRTGGIVVVVDKPAEMRGTIPTSSWERWPSDAEMSSLLGRHCEQVFSTAVSYDDKAADGLLRAWVGRVKARNLIAGQPSHARGVLAVVPEESPERYRARGFDAPYLSRYFGAAWGDRVLLFDIDRDASWPELELARLRPQTDDAMIAWMRLAQDLPRDRVAEVSALTAGWPGLPDVWIEEVRSSGVRCVRAYGARWSAWVAVELARALQVPSLISVHNTEEMSRGVLVWADAIMAVSDAVAQACIAAGADPSRVVTVFNRVDRALFSPEGEAAPGPAGSPRLLCIARDTEQKNLDRLLAACESLLPRFPELRLVHAGRSSRDWARWPFVTHFDSIAHTEVPRWMRWADAFVLPSLWEGFGIVFAEALACGVPVVTSNRAPMNEIVTDRWDGLLCDPENVTDIARAIAELADPGTRARLAAPARAASEPYDIATIEARESALYATLIQPQWPKLSVVLPTFNRRKLVEAAVMNVLSQDYPDLELIVVNDGSSDGTRELLDELQGRLGDTRLRVVHIPNGGLPAALNMGFSLAGGEFWTWTSDDNAFKPGALRAMARELLLDPGLGLVFADYELVHEDGWREVVRTGPVSDLAARNVVGACFLYRASLARQVGAYKPELKLAEDWDYWRRLASVARVGRLARVLYEYGDTADSLSRTRPAEVMQAALLVSGTPAVWTNDYHQQMVRLAGAFKTQGLAWRSLRTACSIVANRPGSLSGYKAVVRALTPMPLLRLSRKLRGADAG